MSDPFEGRPFPRAVLIGAALLIGFVIAVAAFVRMTGLGGTELPDSPAVVSRDLRFDAQDVGNARVIAVADGSVVAELDGGKDGFILGVLRAMGRQRDQASAARDAPYRLSLREDGRLILEDPVTGHRIDLRAFGPDNAGAFAALLQADVPASPAPSD